MSHFADQSLAAFLAATAAKSPTPGGGAVASVTGALAASLAQMVVSYSLGKKNLAAHQPALEEAAKVLENARAMFLRLADEDAAAYGLVNELQRLPETDARRRELPAALDAAVAVPLTTIAACSDILRLMATLPPITNRHLHSDMGIAAELADAAARASRWNVAVNAAFLGNDARKAETLAQANALLARTRDLRDQIAKACTPA